MTTTHLIFIGDRPIRNLHFVDDINHNYGLSNGEPQDVTNRLVNRATACRMEISAEKSKIMTNSKKNIPANINRNGLILE